MELTEQEYASLRWMVRANCGKPREGLYWPSVRRYGPLPEMKRLVEEGFCVLYEHGRVQGCGYWLTAKGRAALGQYSARQG